MKYYFILILFVAVLVSPCLSPNISYARDDESVPDLLRELRERKVDRWIEDRIILKLLKSYEDAKKWLHDDIPTLVLNFAVDRWNGEFLQ